MLSANKDFFLIFPSAYAKVYPIIKLEGTVPTQDHLHFSHQLQIHVIPKTTLSVKNSVEVHRTHWKLLHLQRLLQREETLKSVKGRNTYCGIWKRIKHRASIVLPCGVKGCYFSAIDMWQYAWSITYQGSSPKPQWSEFLLGFYEIGMIDWSSAHVIDHLPI